MKSEELVFPEGRRVQSDESVADSDTSARVAVTSLSVA